MDSLYYAYPAFKKVNKYEMSQKLNDKIEKSYSLNPEIRDSKIKYFYEFKKKFFPMM